MAKKLQPVRGTHDLLPEAAAAHHFVSEQARKVSALAGFEEIEAEEEEDDRLIRELNMFNSIIFKMDE